MIEVCVLSATEILMSERMSDLVTVVAIFYIMNDRGSFLCVVFTSLGAAVKRGGESWRPKIGAAARAFVAQAQ